jgi:ATP-binding cassette subfamily C protein
MLTHYIRTLFRYARARAWISLGLMVFLGLTQGVGLVMLVPFLQMIGLGNTENPGGLAARIGNVLGGVGLPLNMSSILCIYLGIIATHAAVTRYGEVLNARIVHGFTQCLRDRLYRALSQAEWLCFLRSKGSDITHVLTADLQRVGFATHQLLQLIGTSVIAGVHIGVALIISMPMTLFALGCGGGLLLLLLPFNRQAHRSGEGLRGSMNDMYTAITEHLAGMKVAKSYNLGNRHEEEFRNITGSVSDEIVSFTRANAATRMYYEIGAAAALAAFFFVAVEIGRMPAANLLLIVFLFVRILPRFSMIQQCIQRIKNGLPSFKAALEMEKRFETAKEPLPRGSIGPVKLEREVRLSNVSFCYDKTLKNWALRDVDLIIPSRTVTAIVGPSGAGKSTLADLILGLLFPDQGDVSIDGKTLSGELVAHWRRSVGYVPQDTFLFHDSIRANLLCVQPDAQESDLWQVLRMAAAEEFVSKGPEGLDAVVGDRGVRLSGGERQRIALARALLRKPSLLLLDEATSSLDTESEQRIQEAIDRLHGELTIVVIAHRFSTIQRADRIVVLDNGEVVEQGTWNELGELPEGRFRSLAGTAIK